MTRPLFQVTPDEKKAKAIVVDAMISRLEQTYADFIADVKGFDQIPYFFRDHLYSPPNKEARDAALDSLYAKLKSVTGEEMTENIHQLIKLNKLTDDLDLETARVLLKKDLKGKDLDTTRITIDQLNRSLQEVGRAEDRERQIDMVCECLQFFFTLSKLPLIRLVLAPIKVAASMVGAMELVRTMEAGYAVSRGIKDMRPFTDAFQKREKDLIRELSTP
ncbi:MAG: hypothetical protein H7A21_15300 [Spirochaetales bacterium]|nr:hypothetical protein [Leptospiraceae bacterium]MCP5482801.1 hypothetical protein [Spirochaetales bacterium]